MEGSCKLGAVTTALVEGCGAGAVTDALGTGSSLSKRNTVNMNSTCEWFDLLCRHVMTRTCTTGMSNVHELHCRAESPTGHSAVKSTCM